VSISPTREVVALMGIVVRQPLILSLFELAGLPRKPSLSRSGDLAATAQPARRGIAKYSFPPLIRERAQYGQKIPGHVPV